MKRFILIILLVGICIVFFSCIGDEREPKIKTLVIVSEQKNIEVKCIDYWIRQYESWGKFVWCVSCTIDAREVFNGYFTEYIYAYWKEE